MLKNIGSNWALNFVQILVFMVLTPFVVGALGKSTFGIWELVVSTAGPLQLLILGVPMATVRGIAKHLAKGEKDAASRVLGTSISLTLLMGAVTVLVGGAAYLGFGQLLDGLDLEATQEADARSAYWIVIANLAIGFCLRLPYAIYDAHQDFIPRNLIMATGMLSKLGLTVVLLNQNADLVTLATVQVAITVLEFTISFTVSRKRHQGIRFRPAPLVKAQVLEILSFSVFSLLLNMGAMLAFRIDAIVIGANMSDESITTYALGNKLFEPLINLLLAIGMVVMPLATRLAAQDRSGEVRDVFLKWSKVAVTMVLMLGTYFIVLGPEFLAWWLQDEYVPESGRLMQILMASFLLFLPVRGVALPILMGLGRPKGPAFGLVGMGVANLAISIALVDEYGLVGVALGTAIPNVIFATWFVTRVCKELELSLGEFALYVAGKPFLGVLPAAGLLFLAKQQLGLSGFWPLFLGGLIFVGLFGMIQIAFVWKGDRYFDAFGAVKARLGK